MITQSLADPEHRQHVAAARLSDWNRLMCRPSDLIEVATERLSASSSSLRSLELGLAPKPTALARTRCLMMSSAMMLSTPGIICKTFSSAVLMLIFPVENGVKMFVKPKG